MVVRSRVMAAATTAPMSHPETIDTTDTTWRYRDTTMSEAPTTIADEARAAQGVATDMTIDGLSTTTEIENTAVIEKTEGRDPGRGQGRMGSEVEKVTRTIRPAKR